MTASPYWTTSVSDVTDDEVYIRGYPLGQLIGRIPFSAATFLLVRGRMPTPGETRMMDALLCSILDYSLYKPGTVAARYCASANPQMAPALATAVLSTGEYTLAPDQVGTFIQESYARYKESGEDMDAFAAAFMREYHGAGNRVPGFGHPKFRGVDPRAQTLKDIARREGVWGEACEWYEALHRAFKEVAGKPDIVINDMGILAAVLAEMGFAPAEMNGIGIISSLPGVIAHVSEELQARVRIRIVPDEVASYPRERRELDADLAAAGW